MNEVMTERALVAELPFSSEMRFDAHMTPHANLVGRKCDRIEDVGFEVERERYGLDFRRGPARPAAQVQHAPVPSVATSAVRYRSRRAWPPERGFAGDQRQRSMDDPTRLVATHRHPLE